MQSTKKSCISSVPRTVNNYSYSNKNVPRKKHASIQTDKSVLPFEELVELNAILKDDFTFDEKTKKTYSVAVDYINRVHNFMNKSLYEKYGECGDTEPEANKFFKLPCVPNYSTIYLMLLEKTRAPKITEESYNSIKKKDNAKIDTHKNNSGLTEQNAVFSDNIKEVQKRSNGLNICDITLPTVQLETTDTDDEITQSQEPKKFLATHTQENINYVQQVVIYSKTNSFSEEERVVEGNYEHDNYYSEGSDKECGSYIDVIQNEDEEEKVIFEEQSEIEDSVTYVSNNNKVQQNKTQQNKDTQSGPTDCTKDDKADNRAIMDVIKQRVQEEFLTYLNATNLNNLNNEKKIRLAKSNFYGVNIQPQINLFEYAQKKMERRNHFDRETKSAESERPHKVYFNNFLSGRNSMNIKPSTPEKVKNLFRKISQENFSYDDVKYRKRRPHFSNADPPSDNDSVILDDEEFEKMNKCHFKEQKKMEELRSMKNSQSNSENTCEKSHPLKLNGKDMTKLNEKVLSAIGLFTERGDIRPGIIDILEQEKKAKAKDSRNKQFRGRRQWDLQVHLKPKNDLNSWTSVSTEKSFVTLSSDIRSDFDTVKNISHQMDNLKR